MTDKKNTTQEELVPCKVCLTEIPRSAAKVDEASDYVAYFCGLECYDKWRNENHKED